MRHATESDLDALSDLLSDLDNLADEFAAFRCRKRGSYYLKSKAFLHFHEDQGTLLADVKLDGSAFARFNVSERGAQRQLVREIRNLLET